MKQLKLFVINETNETNEVIEIGKLKILQTSITLDNNETLHISSLYWSNDFYTAEFICELNYLALCKKFKNHLMTGDYNINILANDNISNEHLIKFLENGYIPGFIGVTRPSD